MPGCFDDLHDINDSINRELTWTDFVSATAANENPWRSVAYGNGLFVAVTNNDNNGDQVMTSPDGINWTARKVPEISWIKVAYGNGLFVAVADTGTNRVMTSRDGITWTVRKAAENNQWQSVTYGNGRFVAVSSGGDNQVMVADWRYR